MKKIISILVVTAMIFSLVASLNIMSASAASTNLYEFKYFVDTEGDTYQRLYTGYDESTGEYSGKYFQVSGYDQVGKVTYHKNGIEGITDEPVLDIISDKYIWNNSAKIDFTKPVVDISFQYYIPSGTEGKPRCLTLILAKKGTNYNNSTYGTYNFYFFSSNNYVAGTVSGNAKVATKYNTSIVPCDEWHEANLKIIAEEASDGTKTLKVCMYVDGRMHIVCNSTASEISFDDVGIRQLYFNTTKETGNETAGENPNATTYIKNLKIDYEDSDPTMYNTVLFDTCTVNETSKALSVSSKGKVTDYLKSSTSSEPHYETSEVFKNVDYIIENGALKVTLTPSATADARHALIQNFRKDLTSYFPEGTTYMQMSYDVMNPEGSESALKEQIWKFGINTSTSSTNTSVYHIGSRMIDNEIYIFNDHTYDGDEVTKKSVKFKATSGKTYRIIKLLKVTNDGTDYIIHADGYVKDLASDITYKIYESDEVVDKLNGTDGFVLAQQRTDIVTKADKDGEVTPVVTYYDNILARIWDDDFSSYYTNVVNMLPEDANSKFDVELNWYDNNAVAKARDVSGITTQKLVLAAYDSNNKMIKLITSNDTDVVDADKGIVQLTVDSSTIDGVKTFRAFFLDGITTGKPLAKNAVYTK